MAFPIARRIAAWTALVVFAQPAAAVEYCGNDVDDDLNGAVDCGDPACTEALLCQVVDPGMGPLQIGPAGYYFQRPDGKGVVLVGSHTWANGPQRWGPDDPPAPWDWRGYADHLQSLGHNTMRLWTWEHSTSSFLCDDQQPPPRNVGWFVDRLPFARSNIPGASDGGNKFDLTTFDQAYFDNLRDRVLKLANRRMYAVVMLFNGWSVSGARGPVNNTMHTPFMEDNNVNGIAVDAETNGGNADGAADEAHIAMGYTALQTIQHAYLEKVIDTLEDLPNVIYEISNESIWRSIDPGPPSTGWQVDMVDHMKAYMAGKSVQHPICVSIEFVEGDDESLYQIANADCVMPRFPSGIGQADGRKISIVDTDHTCGVCDVSGDEVGSWLTSGHNILYMDEYDCFHGLCFGDGASQSCDPSLHAASRNAIGRIATYSGRLDLGRMSPSPGLRLDAPAPALADMSGAFADVLTYTSGSASVRLDLSGRSGEPFFVEWMNAASGVVTPAELVFAAADVELDNPFGAVAAYLLATQDSLSLVEMPLELDLVDTLSPGIGGEAPFGDLAPRRMIAYPFTTPRAHVRFGLESVQVRARATSSAPVTATFFVAEDGGGVPGAIIEQLPAVALGDTWALFTLPATTAELEADRTYWLGAETAAGTASWALGAPPPSVLVATHENGDWTAEAGDAAQYLVTVPEPGDDKVLVVALGLVLLLTRSRARARRPFASCVRCERPSRATAHS